MNNVIIKVLIKPPYIQWEKNNIFEKETAQEGSYRRAFALFREKLSKCNIKINTWDMHSLNDADVLWFLDIPDTRRKYEQIRSCMKSGAITILQILESPLLTLHAFEPKNTELFNAVISYEDPKRINNRKNYYHYKIPNTWRLPQYNLPYERRKGMLVINTNRIEGIWGMRQKGLSGLPLIGKMLTGWKCSLKCISTYIRGELYTFRRMLVQEAEKDREPFIELYGHGWNGEQISWCPFYPNKPYKTWNGITKIKKDELASQYKFVCAIENFRGNFGYISEKIFDALFAGSVPVYLGDENITDHVPEKCFVDVRKFKNCRELLSYLKSCPQAEWEAMREAGQQFIRSEKIRPFTDEAFAERMLEVLRTVLGK